MSDTYPPSYRLMAESEMRRLRAEIERLKQENARLRWARSTPSVPEVAALVDVRSV